MDLNRRLKSIYSFCLLCVGGACVHDCTCLHSRAHRWRSESSFVDLALERASRVQGIKLSLSGLPSKNFSPMSHLAGSKTEEFTVRLNKLTLGPAPMLCLMILLLLFFFPPKRLINKFIVRTIFVCIIQNNLRILAFWSEKKKRKPQQIRMDEPYSILQSQFGVALKLGEVWNDLTLVVQAYLSMRLLVCQVHGAWRSHPWGWHPHHFRY